jgi:hypothetical protein
MTTRPARASADTFELPFPVDPACNESLTQLNAFFESRSYVQVYVKKTSSEP